MSTFTLQDFQTTLWGKVKVYAAERIQALDRELRQDLPDAKTQVTRGRIRELEVLMKLDETKPNVE